MCVCVCVRSCCCCSDRETQGLGRVLAASPYGLSLLQGRCVCLQCREEEAKETEREKGKMKESVEEGWMNDSGRCTEKGKIGLNVEMFPSPGLMKFCSAHLIGLIHWNKYGEQQKRNEKEQCLCALKVYVCLDSLSSFITLAPSHSFMASEFHHNRVTWIQCCVFLLHVFDECVHVWKLVEFLHDKGCSVLSKTELDTSQLCCYTTWRKKTKACIH